MINNSSSIEKMYTYPSVWIWTEHLWFDIKILNIFLWTFMNNNESDEGKNKYFFIFEQTLNVVTLTELT